MSEILLRWLNDEVRLAVPVANFEEDFANGYSFGELLDRHQMQPDFHLFIDGDHPGAPQPALGAPARGPSARQYPSTPPPWPFADP